MTKDERSIIKMAMKYHDFDLTLFTRLQKIMLYHLRRQEDDYILDNHESHTLYHIRRELDNLQSSKPEEQQELDDLPWPDRRRAQKAQDQRKYP